ncbi:MFS transporter [Mesorhizobium sp. AR07]
MATISASDLMVALVQAASTLPVFFLSTLAQLMATVCTSHPRLDICVAV